jgi:hypothetical protein
MKLSVAFKIFLCYFCFSDEIPIPERAAISIGRDQKYGI